MAAEMGRGHEDSNLQLCLHRPAYASAESDLPNLLTRTHEEANNNEPMFMVPPAKQRRSGDGRRPECANAQCLSPTQPAIVRSHCPYG